MSRTILLADDSLTIQKVVELTFADTDYDVVSLSSGDDLLRKLDEVSPDLVICDIIMPGRDGYDVCQEIKSDPGTLHIPVILLSGTFEPFDRDRALAAGCSEIITKPFEARKLVDTVERLLVGKASDAEVVAEALSPPPPEVPPASDPDMQTLESFPAYAEGPEYAEADSLDAEEELPESSLEFTDTGFAEMEESAQQGEQRRAEIPEDGLEFEFSDEHDAFGTPDTPEPPELPDAHPEFEDEAAAGTAVETEPRAEPETTKEDEAFGDLREIPEFDHMAEVISEASDVETTEPAALRGDIHKEPTSEGPAGPGEAADIDEGEPFPAADTPDAIAESAVTTDDPFASEGADEPLSYERAPDEELDTDVPAADVEADESFEASPETVEIPRTDLPIDAPQDGPEDDVAVDFEFEREIEAEPDIEPPPSDELSREEDETPFPAADTGPVPSESFAEGYDPSVGEPVPEPAAMPLAPVADIGRLSDEDVDRIAHRVLELASDRFEQLAWEIVPDMAEIAVRQRIRELEAEIEGSSDDETR